MGSAMSLLNATSTKLRSVVTWDSTLQKDSVHFLLHMHSVWLISGQEAAIMFDFHMNMVPAWSQALMRVLHALTCESEENEKPEATSKFRELEEVCKCQEGE